jgi:hypothetical protein
VWHPPFAISMHPSCIGKGKGKEKDRKRKRKVWTVPHIYNI